VVGQVADQRIHRGDVGAVADVPSLALVGDEARVRELLEVERQGGGREVERGGDGSRVQPVGRVLDQAAEDRQARRLRQGGERDDGGAGVVVVRGR
jgi:hypothetical protein